MSQPSDTPETDAAWHAGHFVSEKMGVDFARNLEKQRNDLQSKLSTVYQWIERHHQDGFIDSLTYWQNLEKIGDKYGDRIDEAERQRDAAREDARRLAKLLRDFVSNYEFGERADKDMNEALAAHEALTAKA